LWRSVRGGGPGYGVILSLFLQLHKYEKFESAKIGGCGFESLRNVKHKFVADNFYIAYYMRDADFFDGENAKYNGIDGFKAYEKVSFAKRVACSTPSTTSSAFFCDGEGTSIQVVETYKTFVANWNIASAPDLSKPFDLTDEDVKAFQECTGFSTALNAWVDVNESGGGGRPNRFDPKVKAKGDLIPPYDPDKYCFDNPGECLAAEFDRPDMVPPTWTSNPVLIPADLAQEALNKYSISVGYAAFGPGTMHGSDGMDSVTSAFRNAGHWAALFFKPTLTNNTDGFYDDTFFVRNCCSFLFVSKIPCPFTCLVMFNLTFQIPSFVAG